MKTVTSNETTDVLVGERYKKNYAGDVLVHHRKMPDMRATFAMEMIRAWGIVAARPAIGMEPQDKREIALMPTKEVVERACDMAQIAFKDFEDRGWMLNLPSWEEINTPPDAQD